MSKHSATILRDLNKSLFGKKHIAYGRIFEHWSDIIDKSMVNQCIPAGVRYRKDKAGETVCVLKIQTNSALALRLSYQKGLILERINMLIGKPKFVDIQIIHQSTDQPLTKKKSMAKAAKAPKMETSLDQETQVMLDAIDDEELKTRLESYLRAAKTDQMTRGQDKA